MSPGLAAAIEDMEQVGFSGDEILGVFPFLSQTPNDVSSDQARHKKE